MSNITEALEVLRRAGAADFEALVANLDRKRATALINLLRERTAMERANEFCAIGWVMPEVEFLQAEIARDEAIKSVDVWTVTTDLRVIDRIELRGKYRPRTWTREDTWLAQFPRLPDRPKKTAA